MHIIKNNKNKSLKVWKNTIKIENPFPASSLLDYIVTKTQGQPHQTPGATFLFGTIALNTDGFLLVPETLHLIGAAPGQKDKCLLSTGIHVWGSNATCDHSYQTKMSACTPTICLCVCTYSATVLHRTPSGNVFKSQEPHPWFIPEEANVN